MTSALDPCVTQLGLQHKPIFHASMHEILMAINGFVLKGEPVQNKRDRDARRWIREV